MKERHRTTYNEVAEDLVLEFGQLAASEDSKVEFDEKNIRRRVYDALNVLMALDIIVKEKKEIIWRGWSDSSPKADLQAYRVRCWCLLEHPTRRSNCPWLLLRRVPMTL